MVNNWILGYWPLSDGNFITAFQITITYSSVLAPINDSAPLVTETKSIGWRAEILLCFLIVINRHSRCWDSIVAHFLLTPLTVFIYIFGFCFFCFNVRLSVPYHLTCGTYMFCTTHAFCKLYRIFAVFLSFLFSSVKLQYPTRLQVYYTSQHRHNASLTLRFCSHPPKTPIWGGVSRLSDR